MTSHTCVEGRAVLEAADMGLGGIHVEAQAKAVAIRGRGAEGKM